MTDEATSLESVVREAKELGHRKPVHLVVAEALRRRIKFGGFSTGERLPTERELASSLGVGRATVRQAFRQLADEQLIVSRRGRSGGSFVADPDELNSRQQARLRKDFRDSLRTTLEFRLAVEPLGARLAAERATAAQRRRLVKMAHQPSPTIQAFHALDTGFHLQIAEASKNHLITSAVKSSREEYFALGNTLWINVDLRTGRPLDHADSELFTKDHLAIATAIADRDPDAAAAAMSKHISEGAHHFDVLLDRLSA